MATPSRKILYIQGEIKNMRRNLHKASHTEKSNRVNKKKEAKLNGNFCSDAYYWTHGIGQHSRENCFKKSEVKVEKVTPLNKMRGKT